MKYHVNTFGDDTDGFTKGLLKALELTAKSTSKELLIRVGSLANTEGIMSDVLGKQFVKNLIKNKQESRSTPQYTITIFLEGDNTRNSLNFRSGTVFCPWLVASSLSSVLADKRTCDSVFIPWKPTEMDAYIQNNADSIEI
jgi:hypothetical protein